VILNILSWIVTGLIVGLIARALLPGRQSMSLAMTIILGIVGAFAGGLVVSLFTGHFNQAGDGVDAWYWPGWLTSIAGGVLVLWLYVTFATDRTTATGYTTGRGTGPI
jgi:uncharacterized membrane protein YeaQ/YmgE (transglycosylase-associated protein family)